jgi:hypothetical protein
VEQAIKELSATAYAGLRVLLFGATPLFNFSHSWI